MKPFNSLTIALLSLPLFIGCSTTENTDRYIASQMQVQVDSGKDLVALERRLRDLAEARAEDLKAERDKLRTELAALKQAKDTGAGLDQTASRLANFLRISDYLWENKATVVKRFHSEWSPKRESLFSAAGGKGQLLEFEVDDVFFYKGYVVVSSLFLWRAPDGSGGVGRCALSLDPDKNFEAYACEMTGENRLSQAEFANLLGNGQASSQRLEQAAPASASQPFFSERTKEKITDATIGVTAAAISAWLIRAIQSSQ